METSLGTGPYRRLGRRHLPNTSRRHPQHHRAARRGPWHALRVGVLRHRTHLHPPPASSTSSLKAPLFLQCCLGIIGGVNTDPENLSDAQHGRSVVGARRLSSQCSERAPNVTGHDGREMGGHVRVGLEDNLYLGRGQLAPSSAAGAQDPAASSKTVAGDRDACEAREFSKRRARTKWGSVASVPAAIRRERRKGSLLEYIVMGVTLALMLAFSTSPRVRHLRKSAGHCVEFGRPADPELQDGNGHHFPRPRSLHGRDHGGGRRRLRRPLQRRIFRAGRRRPDAADGGGARPRQRLADRLCRNTGDAGDSRLSDGHRRIFSALPCFVASSCCCCRRTIPRSCSFRKTLRLGCRRRSPP